MNFGEIFSRAWNIIWRNKILWVFGLLAALAANGDTGSIQQWNSQSRNVFHLAGQSGNGIPFWAGLLLVMVGLVVFILFIVLSTLGRAALMRGAALADQGTRLSFGQLLNAGRVYFVRVLLLEILLVAAGLALLLVLVIPTVLTLGIGLLCLWPFYLLLGPLFFGLSVLFKLAIAAVTSEELNPMDALRRAWQVFRANLVQVIAMSLILLLGSYVIGSIIVIPAAAALAPVIIAMFTTSFGIMGGGAVLGLFLFFLYLPVLLAASGILMAYIDTAWTLVFRRLTGKTAQ